MQTYLPQVLIKFESTYPYIATMSDEKTDEGTPIMMSAKLVAPRTSSRMIMTQPNDAVGVRVAFCVFSPWLLVWRALL